MRWLIFPSLPYVARCRHDILAWYYGQHWIGSAPQHMVDIYVLQLSTFLHPWPRLAVLQTSLQVIPAWSQLGFPSPPKNVEDVDCASLSVAANHCGIDVERGLDMAGYGRMPKGWA